MFSFGTTPAQTTSFGTTLGQTQPQQQQATTFGSTSSSLFPSFNTSATTGATGLSGGLFQTPASNVAPGQALQATIDSKAYGNNPLFSNIPAMSGASQGAASTPVQSLPTTTEKKTPLPLFKVAPRSTSAVKPRGATPRGLTLGKMFEDGHEGFPVSPDLFVPRRQNIKKLVIQPTDEPPAIELSPPKATSSPSSPAIVSAGRPVSADRVQLIGTPKIVESSMRHSEEMRNQTIEPRKVSSEQQSTNGAPIPRIKLTLLDYYTEPSLSTLEKKTQDELARVEDFVVGKVSVGSVRFLAPVDLRGLNLDAIVHFGEKEVVVYPDEDFKPPVGHGLNKPALITLHKCWPIDKATREPVRDPNSPRLQRHVQKLREMEDTEFVQYIEETGTWIFKVQHFSRYGLADDGEDEDVASVNTEMLSETTWPDSMKTANHRLQSVSESCGLERTSEVDSDFDAVVPPSTSLYSEEFGANSPSRTSGLPSVNLSVSPRQPWTRFPEQIGLPADRVQVMKASFFQAPSRSPARPSELTRGPSNQPSEAKHLLSKVCVE